MVPVTLNNYEAADLSLQSTLKLGAYDRKTNKSHNYPLIDSPVV